MKKIALTALLAVAGMASAQQDPCRGNGSGAPLPSYCSQYRNNSSDAPGFQAAPVYQTPVYRSGPFYQSPIYQSPTYQPPIYQSPIYQPRYVPAPPRVSVAIQPWDDQYFQPYANDEWNGWDGEHVDVYLDNSLVLRNVYRSDVSRLRINRAGRYLMRVVPVGYAYDQPIFSRYYDAPQSGASLTFSFGTNFNIVLR